MAEAIAAAARSVPAAAERWVRRRAGRPPVLAGTATSGATTMADPPARRAAAQRLLVDRCREFCGRRRGRNRQRWRKCRRGGRRRRGFGDRRCSVARGVPGRQLQTDRKRSRDHECQHPGGDQHRHCPDVRQRPAPPRSPGRSSSSSLDDPRNRIPRSAWTPAPRRVPRANSASAGAKYRHRECLLELRHECRRGRRRSRRQPTPQDAHSTRANTALNHPIRSVIAGDRVVDRGLNRSRRRSLTINTIAVSGSMTHTAVISYPMTSAIPRARRQWLPATGRARHCRTRSRSTTPAVARLPRRRHHST